MPESGRFLLDTNIVIGLLNGDSGIREAIREAAQVFIPAIVMGELYFGAANSARPDANQKLIGRFVENRVVLPCDLAVAREYGLIKSTLKTRGTPLPENDIWVGAVAVRHGLTLVSRDRHFQQIEGLSLAKW